MKVTREDMQLYAVTDTQWLNGRDFYEEIEKVLAAGATFLQLREKDSTHEEIVKKALAIKPIARRYGVPFVIDDDIYAALEADVDGVHIGQSDASYETARELLGPDKIIGMTVKTPEQAANAARLGADYVGMGAVFHTSTKKDAKDLSRDNLLKLTAMLDMPIVAIGGINYDNCDYLKDTGVDGIAVVSAIFASDDCSEATRKLYKKTRKLFNYNKNIIFDMDGTLVDSMPFWKNSAREYAARLGADYVGMGAVFHTSTKKDAKDLSRDNLLKLTAMLDMPIVAIGGINYDNCDYLKDTGVDGIAVVSAIFASDDCSEATRKLYKKTRKLFNYNKNIIFDMDGTLVDSMPFWKNSAREYAILRGAKLPKNFDEITGVMDLSEYAAYLQNVLGIDTSLEQITEAAVDIMNKHYASDIPAKKGMIKLIRREYEAGSKLVIFSASDTSSVEILLKRLEIYECFEGIYTVYDVGIGKSDKESYKKVARSAGMDISDTWVYEDILRGVRAAHNAGLKVCAVYDKDSADDWDEICSIADKCIITG